MKILISSKYLALMLRQIDYIHYFHVNFHLRDNDFVLSWGDLLLEINCHVIENSYPSSTIFDMVTWDHVYRVVNKIDEQPIVLKIQPGKSIQIILNC